MKTLGKVALVGVLGVFLVGCGTDSSEPGESSGDVKTFEVNLPDGRTVLCVSEKRGYSGGLSCDWSNAS